MLFSFCIDPELKIKSIKKKKKQEYRPLEEDRKPRNKPMHVWAPYFWQRRQEYTMGQRQFLQSGKTGQLHVKEWN